MAPLRPSRELRLLVAAGLVLCSLPLIAGDAPGAAPATTPPAPSSLTRASPLSTVSTSLTAPPPPPSLPRAPHDKRARSRGRSKGAAATRLRSRRGDDDDDDGGGGLLGLGSLPGLGSLGLPGLKVGSMGPMSLLPALLPLGMLPTSLAQLAAAVLAASTLGQFALGRALMQLVRDIVFGPRPGPHIVYKNKGWESHRMPHAPSAPVLTHVPPDVQMLLHSAALANLPMKPGTQPLVNYVPSHEVPEPPLLLHEVHRPVTHEFLLHPPAVKLPYHGHPKLPPSYKTPHTFPHHNLHLPPEQSLLAAAASNTKKKPASEEASAPSRPHDTAPEHAPGPVYEFPQEAASQGRPQLQETQRPRVPFAYANRPVPAPAPVTEQAERRRRPLPPHPVPAPPPPLARHHAELLQLPHPHPVALPASLPEPPRLPDYHLHVVQHGAED